MHVLLDSSYLHICIMYLCTFSYKHKYRYKYKLVLVIIPIIPIFDGSGQIIYMWIHTYVYKQYLQYLLEYEQ